MDHKNKRFSCKGEVLRMKGLQAEIGLTMGKQNKDPEQKEPLPEKKLYKRDCLNCSNNGH